MATIIGTEFSENKAGTNLDDFITGYPTTGPFAGFNDFDGNDRLFGFGGNDTLRGGNQDDQLYGGDGNDILFGGINPSFSGNDYLVGELGDDVLDGGAGADSLVGGFGNDKLTGGAGGDKFVFNSSNEGTDTIADFSVFDDTVVVSKSGFNSKKIRADSFLSSSQFHIGAAAHDRSDRFIYNSLTGALSFDADGSRGGFAQVQVAQLSAGLAMTKRDIYVTA